MKKKMLAVGIILLFVATGIIPSIAQNIEKPLPASRGNWLYVGGSGPGNYTRIQDAIDNASNGDTVFVYSGWYNNSDLSINKSISVIGEGRDTTFIRSGANPYHISVKILHDNVVFKGFSLLLYNQSGIVICERRGVQVLENYVESLSTKAYGEGIFVQDCNSVNVSNNTVRHFSDNLYIETSKNIMITGNIIDGNNDYYCFHGVHIYLSKKIILKRNTIKNYQYFHHYAIIIDRGHFSIFQENNFLNNTYNVVLVNSFLTVWQRNYWNESLTSPKLIPAYIRWPSEGPIEFGYKKYDWHPAQEPYDIGV